MGTNLADISEKVKQLRQGIVTEASKMSKPVTLPTVAQALSGETKIDKRKKPADEKRLQILKEGREKRAQLMREAKEKKRQEKLEQGIKNEYNKPNSLKNKLKIQSDKIDELDKMIARLADLEKTVKSKDDKKEASKDGNVIKADEIKIEKIPEPVKVIESEESKSVINKKLLIENHQDDSQTKTDIVTMNPIKQITHSSSRFENQIGETVKTYKPLITRRRDDRRLIK